MKLIYVCMFLIGVVVALFELKDAENIPLGSDQILPTGYNDTMYTADEINRMSLDEWVKAAAESTLNYNYKTLRMDVDKSKVFFSVKGWNSFLKAMQASGLIETTIENERTIVGITTSKPEILVQPTADNPYMEVEVKAITKYVPPRFAGDTVSEKTIRLVVLKNEPDGLDKRPWLIEQYIQY